MEKTATKKPGKWRLILGSDWDGTTYVFNTAQEAASFAQQAANNFNPSYRRYGRRMPDIQINFLTPEECERLEKEYAEELLKESEANQPEESNN